MPTVSAYPNATRSGDWTPSAGGGDHHLLVDDTLPPGGDTDYIQVTGYLNTKIEEFDIPDNTTNLDTIISVRTVLRIDGSIITDSPGLLLQLFVGGVEVGGLKGFGGITTGFENKELWWNNIYVPAATWKAGPRTVRITNTNGNSSPEYIDYVET